MKTNTTLQIAARIGLLVSAAVGAFIAGYSCIFGATLTGLREGGWNWQFLPFVFGGWVLGILVALIASIVAFGLPKQNPIIPYLIAFASPVVVSFLVGAIAFPVMRHSDESQRRRYHEHYENEKREYLRLAEKDPSIVIRDRWLSYANAASEVLKETMHTGKIAFSEDQLETLYQKWGYSLVFSHPACTPQFLSRHFESAREKARGDKGSNELRIIVSNPSTPIELVESVSASTDLPSEAVDAAKQSMEARKKDGRPSYPVEQSGGGRR